MGLSYQKIIEIGSALSEVDFYKDNLTLVYELSEREHKKLDEDLFYRTKQDENGLKFEHQDIIEVTIADINFKFIKKEE